MASQLTVRWNRSNAAILGLGLVLMAARAQAPTGKTERADQNIMRQSQPGAQGQAIAVVQAPVPVPAGPVPPSQIKPAPPTPIAVKEVELGHATWDPAWDVVIEENLPQELLSPVSARDVRPFCPRFNTLPDADKRAFWAYFFQALAGAEAGLKPTANVRHTGSEAAVLDTVSHRAVRQEGLLQLTYMDAERYGCDFDWEADKALGEHDPGKTILQPKNNLMCGLRILKNQLVELKEPLLTPRSYWATLRPDTLSYRVFAKQMANAPIACGARPAHAPKRQSKTPLQPAAQSTPPAPASAETASASQ